MKTHKLLYWSPRILSVLFVLFLTMFSFDVFEGEAGFGEKLIGLIIHNIPSIILTIFVLIAWKKEIVGAVVFGFGGLLYLGFILLNGIKNQFEWYMISWILLISGPAFIVSFLFFMNSKTQNKIEE